MFKEMTWLGLCATWGKLGHFFWASSYDLVDDVAARLIRLGRLGSLDDIKSISSRENAYFRS